MTAARTIPLHPKTQYDEYKISSHLGTDEPEVVRETTKLLLHNAGGNREHGQNLRRLKVSRRVSIIKPAAENTKTKTKLLQAGGPVRETTADMQGPCFREALLHKDARCSRAGQVAGGRERGHLVARRALAMMKYQSPDDDNWPEGNKGGTN